MITTDHISATGRDYGPTREAVWLAFTPGVGYEDTLEAHGFKAWRRVSTGLYEFDLKHPRSGAIVQAAIEAPVAGTYWAFAKLINGGTTLEVRTVSILSGGYAEGSFQANATVSWLADGVF